MRNLIVVLFVCLLWSCNDSELEYSRDKNSDVNIYLVKEGQLEIYSSEIDLKSLELEGTPWVKDSDIEFYDWSAHSFFLKDEIEKGEYSGRHFVVTSGKKRLFAGIFFPMHMSSFPALPSISPEDGFFSPKDVIRFGHFGYHRPGELNDNQDFKAELISSGILREGIQVEITGLKRVNSTTLKYTYQVKNIESGNIYILDPQKMGTSRFHYFTNGVSLIKDEHYYWAKDVESTASENIILSWYTKLKPGQAITRTIQLGGYHSLPTGKVNVTFSFPGANLKNKGEWKKSDGRIWVGNFITEQELNIQ
jgi:hypothetical protein